MINLSQMSLYKNLRYIILHIFCMSYEVYKENTIINFIANYDFDIDDINIYRLNFVEKILNISDDVDKLNNNNHSWRGKICLPHFLIIHVLRTFFSAITI